MNERNKEATELADKMSDSIAGVMYHKPVGETPKTIALLTKQIRETQALLRQLYIRLRFDPPDLNMEDPL